MGVTIYTPEFGQTYADDVISSLTGKFSKNRYHTQGRFIRLINSYYNTGVFDFSMLKRQCRDKDLSEEEVTGWVAALKGKSSSRANQVIVIRIFLEQLIGYGIRPYIPPIPKVNEDSIPYIFSDKEMTYIFTLTDELKAGPIVKNKYIHLEFPMIIRLMYGCGLRIGETLSLQVKNLDCSLGVLTLRYTKGDKERLVPMYPSLIDILKNYCMAMGIIGMPDAYLFPELNFDRSLHKGACISLGYNKNYGNQSNSRW